MRSERTWRIENAQWAAFFSIIYLKRQATSIDKERKEGKRESIKPILQRQLERNSIYCEKGKEAVGNPADTFLSCEGLMDAYLQVVSSERDDISASTS